MGSQKHRLRETVLLGTHNICQKGMDKRTLTFYAQNSCLSKPMTSIQFIQPYYLCHNARTRYF